MPTNLASAGYNKRFRALFVGPTGAGKTIAAASWPGKTLDIDADKRHGSLIDWYKEKGRLADIDVEEIDVENFFEVMPVLTKRLMAMNPYANIITDGVTSISTILVVVQLMAKGALKSFKDATDKQLKEIGKVTKGGIAVPGWDEFNGEATYMSMLLEGFKSLDCNYIMTAHPVTRTMIKAGTEGATRYTSITSFGPKVESLIPTAFDNVWFFTNHFETDERGKTVHKRLVYTRPHPDYDMAKTSYGKIPAIIDITDKSLYDCVKDYL